MKRFQKIYLEISNICNLRCAFCPGTKRRPSVMTEEQFAFLLARIRPFTDYLYFHLMGEPLAHPKLSRFLELAHAAGFKVILTTNGTLLQKQQAMLLSSPGLHKINISLHAFEANDLVMPFSAYLEGCFSFGKAAEGKKLVVYRLWNHGGADLKNAEILAAMERYFAKPWVEDRRGMRVGERVFLDYGEKFDWPDLDAQELGDEIGCYGLRDQIGVLADGTVVPCCLDHDGDIALGNLFSESMEDILQSPRAKAIYEGFLNGKATEPLCRRCGYAHMRFGRE
ncbi:MAG: SPASM domain-containing protein [Clostridia bacterium]|nr:SPASM domain-containing protein [Clostridia bacterium]